jgi:hypothetical protein
MIPAMTKRVFAISTLLLLGAACSSNKRVESVPADTTTTTSVVETTTTMVETTTTVPPTTEAPATTTTTPPETAPPTTAAPDFTLRGSGVGTWVFTDAAQAVVDGLASGFGAPTRDETTQFPIPDSDRFINAEDEVFKFPVGRTVCFANSLCTIHGGPTAEALTFVGWFYPGDELPPTLYTEQGITLESRWADFVGVMDVQEGGCYSDGNGTTPDGILLYLRSLGTPFSGVDGDGKQIGFLFGDC